MKNVNNILNIYKLKTNNNNFIINTLIKFDDTGNEYDAKFVNVSLEKWLDLFNENTYNTPLIKPSSVFKNYK